MIEAVLLNLGFRLQGTGFGSLKAQGFGSRVQGLEHGFWGVCGGLIEFRV